MTFFENISVLAQFGPHFAASHVQIGNHGKAHDNSGLWFHTLAKQYSKKRHTSAKVLQLVTLYIGLVKGCKKGGAHDIVKALY